MIKKNVYAFKNEKDLDNALLAGRAVKSINLVNSRLTGTNFKRVFAKVDVGQSGYSVTAKEVKYDSSANGGDGGFVVPASGYWIFDSANITNDRTTTNIHANYQLQENEIVEVFLTSDTEEAVQWLTYKSQSPALTYMEIISSVNANEYTADIYDNPTDLNLIEEDVTVYAKLHAFGTIPNSASGKGLWAIKGNDDKYYLVNYPVFFGS